MDSVTITWYFHSFFTVAYNGYIVAIDPYNPKMLNIPPLTVDANVVLCSHPHDDHHYIEAVRIVSSKEPPPIAITEILSVHDDKGGNTRGKNTIFVLQAGDLRIAHFGDQGALLQPEQITAIGGVDVALIPVGGYYTVDAAAARIIAEAVGATVVIPMHYRTKEKGLPVLADIRDIVTRFHHIVEFDSNRLVVTKETPKMTAVLRFGGESNPIDETDPL